MYIHIGDDKQVSVAKTVGIFNIESLKISTDNAYLLKNAGEEDKLLVVNTKNEITYSKVSPYTVMKRTSIIEDAEWRKNERRI